VPRRYGEYARSSVTLCTMRRHAAVVLPAHTALSPTERGATPSSLWKLNLIISKKVTKVSLKSRLNTSLFLPLVCLLRWRMSEEQIKQDGRSGQHWCQRVSTHSSYCLRERTMNFTRYSAACVHKEWKESFIHQLHMHECT